MIRTTNFTPATQVAVSKPGDWVSINPQPLPPKNANLSNAAFAGVWAMINPQPLPPKVGPENFLTAASGSNSVAQRGIIIVGGKIQ